MNPVSVRFLVLPIALTALLALGCSAAEALPLKGPSHGAPLPGGATAANFLPNVTEVVRPAATVRSLPDLIVELKFELPPSHEINREAPGRVAVRSPMVGDALIAESPLDEKHVSLPLHWGPKAPALDRGDIVIEAAVYFCEESKKSICKIRSLRIFQPIVVDPAHGAERLSMQVAVPEN